MRRRQSAAPRPGATPRPARRLGTARRVERSASTGACCEAVRFGPVKQRRRHRAPLGHGADWRRQVPTRASSKRRAPARGTALRRGFRARDARSRCATGRAAPESAEPARRRARPPWPPRHRRRSSPASKPIARGRKGGMSSLRSQACASPIEQEQRSIAEQRPQAGHCLRRPRTCADRRRARAGPGRRGRVRRGPPNPESAA